MKQNLQHILWASLFLTVLSAAADELTTSLQALSERVLLDESTAAEQAATEARSDSGAGLELRPGYSEDNSSHAVRLYLPSRWTQTKLHEQLSLVAQSEELRVAALEWQDLLSVYRDFCTYRMLNKQLVLLTDEIDTLTPSLNQADLSVQQHQFSVTNRAKLYGEALDLLNAQQKVETELLGGIYSALGKPQSGSRRLSEKTDAHTFHHGATATDHRRAAPQPARCF